MKTPWDWHHLENCVCVLSCVQLFGTLWTVAYQAPLSKGFSRQEYWSVLPFPPLEDLPHPGIKPTSPAAPSLAGKFFTTELSGKPLFTAVRGFQNKVDFVRLCEKPVMRINSGFLHWSKVTWHYCLSMANVLDRSFCPWDPDVLGARKGAFTLSRSLALHHSTPPSFAFALCLTVTIKMAYLSFLTRKDIESLSYQLSIAKPGDFVPSYCLPGP